MVLANESINFLKSALEKTENGFVKIKNNKASETREQSAAGKATLMFYQEHQRRSCCAHVVSVQEECHLV